MIPPDKLQEIVLQEIINEFNIRQKAAITFNRVELLAGKDQEYEGRVNCSEPSHAWDIPLQLRVEGNTVHWNLNELGWHSFSLSADPAASAAIFMEARALESNGNYPKAFEEYARLEMHAREHDDGSMLAESLRAQARLLIHRIRQFDRGIEKLALLAELGRTSGSREMEKEALIEQAYAYVDGLRDFPEAIRCFSAHEQMCLETGDRAGLLASSYGLAVSLAATGTMFGAALDKYAEAEQLAGELGKKSLLKKIMANVADILFTHAENYEKANEKLEEYAALCREEGDRDQLEVAVNNQAKCLLAMEQYSAALRKYDERIRLCEEKGSKQCIAYCLIQQGYILSHHLDLSHEALLHYQQAEPLCIETGDEVNLKAVLQSEAFLLRYKIKNYEDAAIKYAALEALSRKLADEEQLMTSLSNQAWIFLEKLGDYEAAYKKSVELEEISKKKGNRDYYKTSLANQVHILNAWGEKDAARAKKKALKSVR
jgi:tetratricopeptide (TPR) repeat protein